MRPVIVRPTSTDGQSGGTLRLSQTPKEKVNELLLDIEVGSDGLRE
jgi:hypothetical protein